MSKYKPEFWGLDIETTDSDVRRAATIQIGVVAPNGHSFCELIGGWVFTDDPTDADPDTRLAYWSPVAAEIHKIGKEELSLTKNRYAVDRDLAAFIAENTDTDKVMNRITVGWNVGGFDMPFVRRDLPLSGALLSYRSCDLNSILFALALAGKGEWNDLKSATKKLAAESIEGDTQWHNAGFDAAAGLNALYLLTELIGKEE